MVEDNLPVVGPKPAHNQSRRRQGEIVDVLHCPHLRAARPPIHDSARQEIASLRHAFEDQAGPLRSINAARVASLPDDLATHEIIGRRGIELVSGLSLGRELSARAKELGLDPGSTSLLRDFSGCLAGSVLPAATRILAVEIATEFGRRLGCLVLMLSRGEQANRAARPDWGDAQWAFWGAVRRVVIGGGLLSGAIGDVALPEAQAVLDGHDAGQIRLERSPWGDRIALVGLARLLPIGAEPRAILDFGQTSVKRGVARYRNGRLAAIRTLTPRPGFCTSFVGLPRATAEVERQWEAMLDLVLETAVDGAAVPHGTASPPRAADVAACLACYMNGGRPDPVEATSCYGRLQALDPDVEALGRRVLAERLRSSVRFRLLDDGTAAALSVDPDEDTVVLTIGTAIGVGFPLPRYELAPLAHDFALD